LLFQAVPDASPFPVDNFEVYFPPQVEPGIVPEAVFLTSLLIAVKDE
jgi:hypothetical protein